jgi:VCBS repeat-containing protein/ELWxxDGT repeat protein
MAKITPTNFASDDAYSWTEDQLLSSGLASGNVVTLNVLANDKNIKPGSLYSIDDGNGHPNLTDNDLLAADANGVWESTSTGDSIRLYNGTIQLDLSHALAALGATDIVSLAAGDHIHEDFVYAVRIANGTLSQAEVTVDLYGQNDPATITPSNHEDTSVTEAGGVDNAITGDPYASGQLIVVDPDHGQSRFQAVGAAALIGSYGAFTFDASSGQWTYTLDQAKADPLTATDVRHDTLTVTSLDGTASRTIDVTVQGSNDFASIGGALSGAVSEDGTLVTGGTVTVADVDAGQNHAEATSPLHGTYGDFTYDSASGAWTYTLRNGDANVQALTAGQQVHDGLTLTSLDGTDTKSIDVTVTGAGKPASIYYADRGGGLWVTDGTPGAEVLVTGQNLSPQQLTVSGSTVFFSGDDHTGWGGNRELWKTDGTAAGTVLVKDISFQGGGSRPSDLTDVNGTLFFFADDGVQGRELWKSDGTTAGTVMVGAGISLPSYGPAYLTNVGGTLYFVGTDGTHGNQLWKSDGSAAGTVMLTDLNNGGFGPTSLTDVGGTLYFAATDTPANLGGPESAPAYDGGHGWELWKTDGTAAGTTMVADINPEVVNPPGYVDGTYYPDGSVTIHSSSPQGLVNVDGSLDFLATSTPYGEMGYGPWDIWTLAGPSDQPVDVATLPHAFGHDLFGEPTSANGLLFFTNVDAQNETGLWRSDGTAGGTVELANFNGGILNYNNNQLHPPREMADVDGTLFFQARVDPLGGTNFHDELWTSDGTVGGTVMVQDFGTTYSRLDQFTNVNGLLYFEATSADGDTQLWKSNGTAAGTVEVASNLVSPFDTYQVQAFGFAAAPHA